jgi:hypothetical protein
MSDRIEELLEEVVAQQVRAADTLESVLECLEQILEELNWVGDLSFAKQVVNTLDRVEAAVTAGHS